MPQKLGGGLSRYSDAEIHAALVAAAKYHGNYRAASRETGINKDTLRFWIEKKHAERYRQIQAELTPVLRARAAEEYMARAEVSRRIEEAIDAQLIERLDQIPARDLPGAKRNVATAGAIATDKAAQLRGEATTIVEHRKDMREIARSLNAKGISFDLDADAVEVVESPAD